MSSPAVFIEEAAITARVREMAATIRRDYGADAPVHLIGVLKGSFVFLADLMRAIGGPVTCDFMAISTYGAATTSSGEVRLLKDLDRGIEDRDVIIVEDIVDTGVTLSYLHEMLHARAPRSVRTACLLSKPSRRKIEVKVEYVGFTIEDRFVVGYGLDFDEKYRNLPHISVLDGEKEVAVRKFSIITEADARQIEPGSTVELEPKGHVTPLAQDTLRARHVTVVPAGSADPALPEDLAPVANVTKVAIGSDHTGVKLKAALIAHLRKSGRAVADHGTNGADSVDYPDIAAAVGKAIARGEADAGIVIDGAGIGSAIAANKIRGVRAALASDLTVARYARQHNGANVVTLGSTFVDAAQAIEIVDTFLTTPMTEARYIRRLLKVRRLEETF